MKFVHLISIASGLITIFMFTTGITSLEAVGADKSFLITLLKTPVVYIVIVFTFVIAFYAAIIDLIRYYFFSNETLWDWTPIAWEYGWNDCTVDWYWNSSVGSHILISVIIWIVIIQVFAYFSPEENDI